jgi:CcmD family protein
MNNLGFLIAGYFVFWLATFAYIHHIGRRQREVLTELQSLLKPKS